MRKLISFFAAIFVAFLMPCVAFAADVGEQQVNDANEILQQKAAVVKSGTWGACPWEFADDGTLTVYPGDAGSSSDAPWKISALTDLEQIVFKVEDSSKVVLPVDSSYLFEGLNSLKAIDFSGIDTSKVKTMDSMFRGCSTLSSLDLSAFDTSSVQGMRQMFSGCSSLVSLGQLSFDVSNVIYMEQMFSSCSSLASFAPSFVGSSKVTNMYGMFSGCSSLSTLDLSSLSSVSVTDMSYMFYDCSSLDISSFDASGVTNMRFMFYGCRCLSEISLGEKWLWRSQAGFGEETGFPDYWTDGVVLKSSSDLVSAWDGATMAGRWYLATPSSGWNAAGGCEWKLDEEGTFAVRPLMNLASGVLDSSLKRVINENKTNVKTFKSQGNLICTAYALSPGGFRGGLFSGCRNLESIDLSAFDTSSVTDMAYMFNACSSLVSLDLSAFDTSKVKDMTVMFASCSSLSTLDLSSLSSFSVTSMSGMFKDCSSLASLDISSFDTSSVADMSFMFIRAPLETLILGQKWAFKADVKLWTPWPSDPPVSAITGKELSDSWSNGAVSFTTAEFVSSYDGATMAGTWSLASPETSTSIGNAIVEIVPSVEWSGAPLTPAVTVMLDGVVLREGTDYSISYADNTAVGTATVTIEGYGDYAGRKTASFAIAPRHVSKASAAAVPDQLWTGAPIAPKVELSYGGDSLVEGRDYTLSYSANIDPGTAVVAIAGKGNYAGSLEVRFEIVKKGGDETAPAVGWVQEDGVWRYFTTSGDMATGWQKVGAKWYYLDPGTGVMLTGWQKVGGTWYYLRPGNGDMATGWIQLSGKWYYLDGAGAMQIGWRTVGGARYYFDATGAMVVNSWVGGSYVGPDGAVVRTR